MNQNLGEIASVIAQFEVPGWVDVTADRIKVTPIGDGCMNITLKVERINGKSGEDAKNGPKSLVYKKYGGNVYEQQAKEMGFNTSSPIFQSLIFYETSKLGWGPVLHGLFENGRVEEFVDCHTLTGMEAFEPEISRDVAKAYARFHSLKLPISQQHFDMLITLLPSVDSGKKQLAAFIEAKNITEDHPLMCFKRMHDFPFHEEADWINSIRPKIQQRTVLATMDPNYLNRLVRNQKPSDPNATRTLIIDFDNSSYSDRGYDLGGHFVLRMFGEGDFTLSGMPHPSEEEKVVFLSAYLEEAEKLFDDFDTSSLDSLDNLILECDLNALVYITSILVCCLKIHTILNEKPGIADFMDPFLTLHKELKEKFCTKYLNLVN